MTRIPQSTISAIDNDRVRLGVDRAKVIARALKCHPAVVVFPGWEVGKELKKAAWLMNGAPTPDTVYFFMQVGKLRAVALPGLRNVNFETGKRGASAVFPDGTICPKPIVSAMASLLDRA